MLQLPGDISPECQDLLSKIFVRRSQTSLQRPKPMQLPADCWWMLLLPAAPMMMAAAATSLQVPNPAARLDLAAIKQHPWLTGQTFPQGQAAAAGPEGSEYQWPAGLGRGGGGVGDAGRPPLQPGGAAGGGGGPQGPDPGFGGGGYADDDGMLGVSDSMDDGDGDELF